jgi:uncharacterized protein (DUF58 family)
MTVRTLAATLLGWLKPRRRFPPTREGWWFLIATLLLGLAAINAGLNLLFLVWGMMLFLVLASGVLSELCLRDLEVKRTAPTAIHAGAPYLMGISLTNLKKRQPSFSVEVEDLVAGRPIDKRCYFLKLPAGRTQETAYRHLITRRGRHQLSGFRLSTKFPFGLIQKSRDVAAPMDLLIYPALVNVPESMLHGLPASSGLGRVKSRARNGDFFGLRDYRPGDEPRDIHWRTTARRGVPFVRESEDDEGMEATILFDNASGGATAEAFERAVSLTASVAVTLIRRGYRISLGVRGGEIARDGGAVQATRILRLLAVIEPASAEIPLHNPGLPGARIWVRVGAAIEADRREAGIDGLGPAERGWTRAGLPQAPHGAPDGRPGGGAGGAA